MGILINTGFDVGSSSPIDNRTLKETTLERDALVTDGLVYENLKVYCKDTQTEYRWTGTDWEEVGTGGTVDLSGYAKTYTSLTELGLTADVTVEDVVNALENGESFLAPVNTFTNYETIFPNKVPSDQWNKIHIIKGASLPNSHIRCFSQSGACEYLANVNNTNVVSWNDVSGTYINISDSIIEKLGTEILKYPIGKYRINSTTTGNKFTDLPSDAEIKCGAIEINGTAVGKSPFTDTWVYRTYKFETLIGSSIYTRRLNSGATAGQVEVDTRWRKVGQETYTSLSQLGLTADATIQDVIDAIPIGCTALLRTDGFTDWSTLFNGIQYGYLKIEKTVNALSNIELQEVVGTSRRYFGTQSSGKFNNWKQMSPVTLVTNTATLKLDVTKKNSGWYGAIKLTYLYDTSPAEIEISFRAATEDLRWAVINGQKYIKKITFTQDSSNTTHYTIGIEFSGTTYGCYQAEVIGDFAVINSLTNETFTGAKTAVYYSPWGKNNGVTLVSAPEDIGLTFPCTTVQLAQAMRNKFNVGVKCGVIGLFNCEGKASTITDAPSDYGLLHIETFGHDRILIRFDGIGSSSYTGSWIGQIKGNNGAFSGITWSKLIYEENLSALNTGITTLNTKTTELNTKIATIENTKIAAINTKITAIENTTNNSAIKNITDNTLTVTSNTFKVVINSPTSEGYWFIKFKYYIGGKEYEALIMSEVYDRYWSGNAALVSSITSSANSQTNGTWNFSVGIKLSSSVTGVKIVECPSVVNLVSFTTQNFTGANTHEKKS